MKPSKGFATFYKKLKVYAKLKTFKKQVKTNKASSGIVTPIKKFNRSNFHLKMFFELLTGKNLPTTYYITNNNLKINNNLTMIKTTYRNYIYFYGGIEYEKVYPPQIR